jgi:hypothetical protein
MESPLLEQGLCLLVAVKPGCLELRVTQEYPVSSSSSTSSHSSAGLSRGLPSWPAAAHVVFGWRHLTHPLRLRAALSNGVGEYEVREPLARLQRDPRPPNKTYIPSC